MLKKTRSQDLIESGPIFMVQQFCHIYVPPPKVRGDILVSVRIPLESASAWQNLVPTISLEPVDGIPPNLPGYIIGTSLRADQVLVTLTPFSSSQEDLDT